METKAGEQLTPTRSAPDGNERRAHQRVRCQGTVELRRIPPAPPESIYGKIINLSEGGCYLETERPLETGTRLVMEVRVDGLELRLIAEVRSAETAPPSRAGLEFVGISAEGLEKLRALIEVFASGNLHPPETVARR